MKKRNILWMVVGMLISMTACTRESMEGPQGGKGPVGDAGPKGEQGEPGNGISNVHKFSFTIDRGTNFYNATSNPTGVWAGVQRGLGNNGAAYVITPANIGGMSVSDPNYLVIAYVRPEGGNAFATLQEQKMIPASYSASLQIAANNVNRRVDELRIELLTQSAEILVSRIQPTNQGIRSNPIFSDMPAQLHVVVHFIEIANKL